MNALVPSGTMAIVPQTFDDAVRLAKAMSQIPELPEHCKNVGTCLMIVDQAMRWRMSPFAVAQCSSNIKGKMMYEGKLMAAAVESMGAIKGHFDYTFTGEGENRTVTVTATRTGDDKPREIKIRLGDVQTNNEQWKKQPDQQLVYSGSRNWARRWTPAALLGAYSPEEFSPEAGKPAEEFAGTTLEGAAETKVEEPKPDAPKPEPSLRDQYNRDVPLNDPPKTIKITGPEQFLDWFQDAARACADGAEFAQYLEDPDVVRMRKGPRNAHRARLEGIIAEGTARFGLQAAKPAAPPVDDAGWPGPDPEQMRREREAAAVA